MHYNAQSTTATMKAQRTSHSFAPLNEMRNKKKHTHTLTETTRCKSMSTTEDHDNGKNSLHYLGIEQKNHQPKNNQRHCNNVH